MSKYGNKKVIDGANIFDSEKEYRRWCELRLMERAGVITDLQRQVKYELIPQQKDEKGKILEKACCYVADFVYKEKGKTIVEDTKGMRTKEYVIKRKLMLRVHGIRVREV